MSRDKKLESLIGRFINDGDPDDIVRSDLEAFGVDLLDEKQKFRSFLDTIEASARQRVLDEARTARVSRAARRDEVLGRIRRQQLPLNVLAQRASDAGGARAHRDFQKESRDDLESLLADLMLDAEDQG